MKNIIQGEGLAIRVDNSIGVAGVTDPTNDTARAGSATNWFLASRPNRTLIVAYLAGSGRGPQIRPYTLSQGQWGVGWDIKMDIGAKALGYRGLFKSTGAG